METLQRKHIQKNLKKLVDYTTCDIHFLLELQSEGLLTAEDVEAITSTKNSFDQSLTLYGLLQTRTNGYNALKKALKITRQTGAVAILSQLNSKPEKVPGKIILGRDCAIRDVVRVLRGNAFFGLFLSEWSHLAKELNLPSEVISNLRQNLLLDKMSLVDVIHAIIENWVAYRGSEASLDNFFTSLRNLNLNAIASSLEEAFPLLSPSTDIQGIVSQTDKTQHGRHYEQEESSESDEEDNISGDKFMGFADENKEKDVKISSDDETIGELPQGSTPTKEVEHVLLESGGEDHHEDSDDGVPTIASLSRNLLNNILGFLHNLLCQIYVNLYDLFGRIVEISPYRYRPRVIVTRIALILLCAILVIITIIDFSWEGYQFTERVKGTNDVGGYILFLKLLATIFLRLAFLFVEYRKVPAFSKKFVGRLADRHKHIFTGKKHRWISAFSIITVIFYASTEIWLPQTNFQAESEKDKLAFLESFVNVSKYHNAILTFLAIYQFFLLIVEQYALDFVLVVAYILYGGMNRLMADVIRLNSKLKVKGQLDLAEKADQDQKRKSVESNSENILEEIPLQTLGSTDNIEVQIEPAIESSGCPASVEETNVLCHDCKLLYSDLKITFASTNNLIAIIYSILLFIGLLLVSSLEDTLLNPKVHLLDKIEYFIIFAKVIAIVYFGCSISNSLQRLLSDKFTEAYRAMENVNVKQANYVDNASQPGQPSTQIIIEGADSLGLPQVGYINPIGLGNHPFTMNMKFLTHHLGLALFTIFLGIVSTRVRETNCDVVQSVNNTIMVNGTR